MESEQFSTGQRQPSDLETAGDAAVVAIRKIRDFLEDKSSDFKEVKAAQKAINAYFRLENRRTCELRTAHRGVRAMQRLKMAG